MGRGFKYGPVRIDSRKAAFASVEVRDTNGQLATLYGDDGNTKVNPFQAGEHGVYGFSVEEGTYNVTATLGSISSVEQVTVEPIAETVALSTTGMRTASLLMKIPSVMLTAELGTASNPA